MTTVGAQADLASEPAPVARWSALDVFRGSAVLLMIQGHTFTALLAPAEYAGSWSAWHSLIHGLTAPMFLLGGGLAYGLVTFRSRRTRGLRIVRRALTLLVIGYLLQVPRAPAAEILSQRSLLEAASHVGPLQLIGVCLLIMELLRVLTRTRLQLTAAVAVVATSTTLCAPWVWKLRASQGAYVVLGNWLDGYAGSVFPFFPWAFFFFGGVLLSQLAIHVQRSRRSPLRAALPLLFAGLVAAGGTYELFIHARLLRSVYGAHELWHTSPLYVVFRTGAVCAWLAWLWLLEPWWKRLAVRAPAVAGLCGALAKQSLVAYVVHLLVLYGTPFTTGLVHLGTTLDLAEASAVTISLLAFTTLLAALWQRYPSIGFSVARARVAPAE